jgi:hypothetical protein
VGPDGVPVSAFEELVPRGEIGHHRHGARITPAPEEGR